MKTIQYAAAGLVLALSGCGGGDGGSDPDAVSEAGRRLGGLSEPGYSGDEFAAGIETVADRADTLVLSNLVYFAEIEGLPASFRLSSDCEGGRCDQVEPFFGETFEVTIDDMRVDDRVVGTLSPRPIGEHHGVRTAHVLASDRLETGDAISLEGYAGWTEHGAFLVTVGGVEAGEFEGASVMSAMSLGSSTKPDPDPVPVIAASWNGLVAGADVSDTDTRGNLVQGRARIDLELRSGDAVVGVAFTDLFDLETEEARDSLRWEDLTVTADGFKDESSDDEYLRGRFYGPGHEVAGGVFERSGLLGAFGATKEEPSE